MGVRRSGNDRTVNISNASKADEAGERGAPPGAKGSPMYALPELSPSSKKWIVVVNGAAYARIQNEKGLHWSPIALSGDELREALEHIVERASTERRRNNASALPEGRELWEKDKPAIDRKTGAIYIRSTTTGAEQWLEILPSGRVA
jgi:hypothetical protein